MSSSAFGRRLEPFRKHRAEGARGIRHTHSHPLTPSATAEPRNPIRIQFPQLGRDEVIVPGSTRLGFDIELDSTDADRTVVQNIGRAIVRKQTITFGSADVLSLEHSDIFHCYLDLWKTSKERTNGVYQGIDTSRDRNVTRLRVGAGDAISEGRAADVTVASIYKNRFYIPLDSEFFECHAPVHQGPTGDQMVTEITFNDASQVILADEDSTYHIKNIRLEYDTIVRSDLADNIRNQYNRGMTIQYDRIIWLYRKPYKKEDTIWGEEIKVPSKSLKGILMLWVDPTTDGKDFKRNTERFYNPKIQEVKVRVENASNELFDHGMTPIHQWDEARRFFAGGHKRFPEVASVARDLGLADVTLSDFLTHKYCLWLDFRPTDSDEIHNSGREISPGAAINLQIRKEAEAAGPLDCHIFVIQEATLYIKDGRCTGAEF